MAKFVLFLRGVNVGGVKVLMKDLAALLGEAGYGPVKTLLASGNAILDAPHSAAPELRAHCEQLLADYYGRPIPALAFSAAEVHELAADFPVPVPAAAAEFHRYLTLCASERDAQELYAAAAQLTDGPVVAVRARSLCWISPKGQSLETPVSKLVAAQARQRIITTRNLNTLVKLSTIIRAQELGE
ncbi:DUF1697 domain-containing protein [Glutamicibacter sp. AOP33-2CA-4]|uniref:DUF1697 domain-containing protein n=1 Tax=Glutamicibacter sp. AOP33-2CA-4 TaxID=3457690 RepID=UPI0040347E07